MSSCGEVGQNVYPKPSFCIVVVRSCCYLVLYIPLIIGNQVDREIRGQALGFEQI